MNEEHPESRKRPILLFIALVALVAKAFLLYNIPLRIRSYYQANPPMPGCDYSIFTILALTDFVLFFLILLMNRVAWIASILTDVLLIVVVLPNNSLCELLSFLQLLAQSLVVVTLIHLLALLLLVPHLRDKFSWTVIR